MLEYYSKIMVEELRIKKSKVNFFDFVIIYLKTFIDDYEII